MASISSNVKEIAELFFRTDTANRPYAVKRAVRIKEDSGWLLEDDRGMIHVVGRLAERVTGNVHLLNEVAAAGSTWGVILEALQSLGKITKEQLESHREWSEDFRKKQELKSDMEYVRKICERHGWVIKVST